MWAYYRGKNAKINFFISAKPTSLFRRSQNYTMLRMNIALSVQTSLCCPKHYRVMAKGQADLFKKIAFKKGFKLDLSLNGKFGLNFNVTLERNITQQSGFSCGND
jgi:hypothetical protein